MTEKTYGDLCPGDTLTMLASTLAYGREVVAGLALVISVRHKQNQSYTGVKVTACRYIWQGRVYAFTEYGRKKLKPRDAAYDYRFMPGDTLP
jgi:hypothetical protein